MNRRRCDWLPSRPVLLALLATCAWAAEPVAPVIDVWQGDHQRTGHLGDAQDDYNVLGHVEPWSEIDTFTWSLNRSTPAPISYRAYRRLVADGDFNIDLPVGKLKPGGNQLVLALRLRDGRSLTRTVTIDRQTGSTPLPLHLRWSGVKNPADVGQIVDGRWELTPAGLRSAQLGYDRLFLLGERSWRDYELRTTITVHAVDNVHASAGPAIGVIARFTGHVTGGPLSFPSGQPQWGYQPFGAIAWLHWGRGKELPPPHPQFLAGDSNRRTTGADIPSFQLGTTYALRVTCRTLPDTADGQGVTRYQFKLWPAAESEPAAWSVASVQTSPIALRAGGPCLVAHHVDATFGDISVTPLTPP